VLGAEVELQFIPLHADVLHRKLRDLAILVLDFHVQVLVRQDRSRFVQDRGELTRLQAMIRVVGYAGANDPRRCVAVGILRFVVR
jgi:hypothetical protein